jgi:hypothetical protein
MNPKFIKLLNEFANDHVLATHIKVELTDHHKSFKPRDDGDVGAKYEDANLLSSIIVGAENFCYYLQRNDYEIRRKNGSSKSKKN